MTAGPLHRRLGRGLVLVFLSTAGSRLVSLGADLGLMRLLAVEDFGVVAFGLVVANALNLLRSMGIGEALVARREADQLTCDTAFALAVGFGLGFYGLLAGAAPWIVKLAGRADTVALTSVLRWVGLLVLLQAVAAVPGALIERHLDFGKRFCTDSLPALVYAVVGLGLALAGQGVWSLVWGRLAGGLIAALAACWLSPWRPSWRFDRTRARELIGYGRLIAVAGLVAFLVVNVDDLVVVRLLGVEALGFYARAYLLANLPVTSLAHLANRVAFPAYAHLRGEPGEVAGLYGRLFVAVAVVALPFALGLLLLAEPFTAVAFGERWAPLVPLLRWLSGYGLLRALLSNTGPLFNAMGNPRAGVGVNTVQLAILAVFLAPLTWWLGTAGACLAVLAGTLGSGPLALRRATDLLGPGWPGHWQVIQPLLLPGAAMAAVVLGGQQLVHMTGAGPAIELVVAGATGTAAYLLILQRCRPAVLRQAASLLRGNGDG